MKFLIAPLLAILATTAQAQSNAPTTVAILQSLLGAQAATVPATGTRTYYFAGEQGQTIELSAGDQHSYLIVRAGNEVEFSSGLGPSDESATELRTLSDGGTVLEVDHFTSSTTPRSLYSVSKFTVHKTEWNGHLSLSIKAVNKELMEYQQISENDWGPVLRARPKYTRATVGGRFILSLTEREIQRMGRRAARHLGESRTPGGGTCTIDSEFIMKCQWNLETDYADDTLHGTFSIRDGRISEVLATDFEPGC